MQYINCCEEAKGTSPGTTTQPNQADYGNMIEFLDAVVETVALRLHAIAEPHDACLFMIDDGIARGCYVGEIEPLLQMPMVSTLSLMRRTLISE